MRLRFRDLLSEPKILKFAPLVSFSGLTLPTFALFPEKQMSRRMGRPRECAEGASTESRSKARAPQMGADRAAESKRALAFRPHFHRQFG